MIKKLAKIFNIYFFIALIPYICGLGIAIFLNLVPIIPVDKDRIFVGLFLSCLLFWSIGNIILFIFWLLKPLVKMNKLNLFVSNFIVKFAFSSFLFSLFFLLSILINDLTSKKPDLDFVLIQKIFLFFLKIGQFFPLLLLPRLYEDYQTSQSKYQKAVSTKNQKKIKLLQEKINLEIEQQKTTQQKYNEANLKLQEWQQKAQQGSQNDNELLADEVLRQQTYYSDLVFELQVKLEEINIRLNQLNQELEKISVKTKDNEMNNLLKKSEL